MPMKKLNIMLQFKVAMSKICSSIFIIVFLSAHDAQAWGKRGHALICETAAYLVVDKSKKSDFLKDHSYDLGYYCLVPDLVWKREPTYKKEWFNHFIDLEIFDRELKDSRVENPFELSRLDFEKAFPTVKESAGRSYWRIAELERSIGKITAELKKTSLSKDDRHKLQADWLLNLGVLGHYIGDLSQPLHVTENYDGQLSDQKGIHSWFEDEAVNFLFLRGSKGFELEVYKRAQLKWKKANTKWDGKSALSISQDLAKDSMQELAKLLKIDKRLGRKSSSKAGHAFHEMIVDRMSSAVVALAVLWKRELGWDFDDNKFYTFLTEPEYISYPTVNNAVTSPGKQ